MESVFASMANEARTPFWLCTASGCRAIEEVHDIEAAVLAPDSDDDSNTSHSDSEEAVREPAPLSRLPSLPG